MQDEDTYQRRATDYLSVRDGYSMFVTKEEHNATMVLLNSQIADLKTAFNSEVGDVKRDLRKLLDNRLPSWVLPAAAVLVPSALVVLSHFWK